MGKKSKKNHRNSTLNPSTNSVINALRSTIRQCEGTDSSYIPTVDPNGVGVDVRQEMVLINRKSKKVRRAYMLQHRYKIGWIVDADVGYCMMCQKEFGWFRGRFKHHCRACGALVCHDCSPFITIVPHLDEEKGSRACRNCFGLKPGIFTPETPSPYQPGASGKTLPSASAKKQVSANLFKSPEGGTITADPAGMNTVKSTKTNVSFAPSVATPSTASSSTSGFVRRRGVGSSGNKYSNTADLGTEEAIIQKYLEEMEKFEREQLPKYEEAYRKMRELVPLDVYKSNLKLLLKNGLPEDAATRVFNIKILWLIITHPIDIAKIHLADFRSKYFYDGLDITEMRAIWYVLPDWNVAAPNPLERGKAEWKEGFKSKMDDLVYRETTGTLPPHLIRNPVYAEADFLHLFDPEADVKPRFHRSASFKQEAVESPMPDGLESESESGSESSFDISPIYSAKKPHVPMSVQDRQKMYMKNFQEQDEEEEGVEKESKYRTLLDEINAEALIDDDISSLGLDGSTDEIPVETIQAHLSPGDCMPPPSQSRRATRSSHVPITTQREEATTPVNTNLEETFVTPMSQSLPTTSKYLQERGVTTTTTSKRRDPALGHSAPLPITPQTEESSRNSSSSTVSNNTVPAGSMSPKTSFTISKGVGYSNDELMVGSMRDEYLTRDRLSLGGESVGSRHRTSRGASPIPIRQTPRTRETAHKPIAFPTITPRSFHQDNLVSPYSDDSHGHESSGSAYPYVTIMSEDTPASAAFTSVGSPHSYKFLSTSKSYTKKFSSSPTSSPSRNIKSNPSGMKIPKDLSPIVPLTDSVVNVEDEVKASPKALESSLTTAQSPSSPSGSVQTINSTSNNSATQNAPAPTPAPAKKTKQKPSAEDVMTALLEADIGKVLQLLDGEPLSWVLSEEERNDVFWMIVERLLQEKKGSDDFNMLQDTNLFMIDDEAVNVNVLNDNGQSLLHIAVMNNYDHLGKELIKRGADVVLLDKMLGSSPLALSISNNLDWVVEEFNSSGKEMKLLAFGTTEKKKQYLISFIVAGHCEKAKEILKTGYVKISAIEATALMNLCSGNFAQMKEPVETFELLESLGASL